MPHVRIVAHQDDVGCMYDFAGTLTTKVARNFALGEELKPSNIIPRTCSSVGCWPSFIEVDGVDIVRAPDAATGAPATRRDMNAEVAWVTAADVLATEVDAGDTTNPSAVAARARKAATATDFIVQGEIVGGVPREQRAYVC